MKYLNYLFWYVIGIVFLIGLGYGFYYMYDSGMSVSVVMIIALYSVSVLFNLLIFAQIRHAEAKLSWIIVMTILPVFGHIIFIIFGKRYRGRMSRQNYLSKKTFKHEVLTHDKNISTIMKKQSNISKRGVYKANIELYDNGHEGFEKLFEDIKSAEKFIHIHYYIIKPGEIYEHFKSLLIEKAKQGVEVRFIVDDFGRWAMPWYEIKELRKAGIQVGIFGKVFFPFVGSENGYRTHRKMVLIDGTRIHTGGVNIADEYANLNKSFGLWVDFQTTITGEAVRSYSLLFIDDWKIVTEEELDIKKYLVKTTGGKSRSILVEDSPENVEPILENSLVSWIINAKKSITLSTPYFVPSNEIMSALKTAAQSGVKVTIYIPGKPDKKSVLIVSRYRAEELIEHGVVFKETQNILVHSKIGIFDNKYAYLGTANLDLRSLYSQFELLNLVEGPIVGKVNKLFKYYDEFSKDIEIHVHKSNSFKKLIVRIGVFIFSPLM